MTDLYSLSQSQLSDDEVSFEILPADARLSVQGSSDALWQLFQRASAIVPTKPVVKGTEWMQLEAIGAAEGQMSLVRASASDGEVSISVGTDDLVVKRAGSVLLPAKRIADILRVTPEDTVTFTVLGSTATITSGRARWTVQTPAGDALPPRPDVSKVELWPMRRSTLLQALKIVLRAVSSTSARAALQQALVKDGNLTGSDAGRLHQIRIEGLPMELQTTLPARYLDELVRALTASEEEFLHFGADDLHLVTEIGRDTLIAQRMLLNYPDVHGILLNPTFENTERFKVEPRALAAAVRRILVAADPDQQTVWLDLVPNGAAWNLVVWSRDRTGNTAREVLQTVVDGTKKARTLAVNGKALIELLASAGADAEWVRIGPDTKSKRYPLLVEAGSFTGVLQQQMTL